MDPNTVKYSNIDARQYTARYGVAYSILFGFNHYSAAYRSRRLCAFAHIRVYQRDGRCARDRALLSVTTVLTIGAARRRPRHQHGNKGLAHA